MKTTIGRFELSIIDGKLDTKEVAILSRSTGEFVKLTSSAIKLRKIKREFKSHLCSTTSFCFSFMSDEDIEKLTLLLK